MSLPNLSNETVSIVKQFSTQAFTFNSSHSVYYSLFLHVSATGYDQVQRAASFFVEVCSFLKMVIVAFCRWPLKLPEDDRCSFLKMTVIAS
jgi:hypothetical protein